MQHFHFFLKHNPVLDLKRMNLAQALKKLLQHQNYFII